MPRQGKVVARKYSGFAIARYIYDCRFIDDWYEISVQEKYVVTCRCIVTEMAGTSRDRVTNRTDTAAQIKPISSGRAKKRKSDCPI